jgi:flagellar hook-associated protein 3 FlgL
MSITTRISTSGNYSAILQNLMNAQQKQVEAGNQVSSQKNGQNLKDYAKHAETLTAMLSTQSRLQVYQQQNGFIADKLALQDSSLNQVGDAAAAARQAIADALAAGDASSLMQSLAGQFSNAVQGLNTQSDGKYLFAGGQINTVPVSASQMSDLTAPGAVISDFFHNDSYKAQAKVDDATTVTTGVLASDVGAGLLTGFQAIQAFQEGASGPFSGPLTAAQTNFLKTQLAAFDTVRSSITLMTAQNGLTQKQVSDVKTNLTARDDTLSGMISDITDVNMADAVSRLTLAQTSVQAAAQVFQTLQASSLVNILR